MKIGVVGYTKKNKDWQNYITHVNTVPTVTYKYMILRVFLLGRIFGHFNGVFGPHMTYHMKGGVVGYKKITKL